MGMSLHVVAVLAAIVGCVGWCPGSLGFCGSCQKALVLELGASSAGAAAYVAVDHFVGPNWHSFRIYVESNDQTRLLRGWESMLERSADICQDSPTPDLLVV